MQSANPQWTRMRVCGWVSEFQIFNKQANFDQTANEYHSTVECQNPVLFTYLTYSLHGAESFLRS